MTNVKEPIQELAWKIRNDVLDMTFHAGVEGGHIGGAFSSAEILAVLYGTEMNVNPKNPTDPNRDRFILSKGHISLAHYAVLKECGFMSQEDLDSFENNGSFFSTHEQESIEHGIEVTSGSLGYGLSIGVGISLSAKRKGLSYKTFVLLGDGECNEGSVWEAAMAASKYKLDNLIAIIDKNGLQLDGYTSDIMPIHNIEEVFKGFGWNTLVIDGHDVEAIRKAINGMVAGAPTVVIAETVKSKGLPSIEGKPGWHHARITEEQYRAFKQELEETK